MYKRKEKYKTEEEKRLAIMHWAWNIRYIPNASEEIKRLAVEWDPRITSHIHNPSQELLDYVYKNHRKIFDEHFEKVGSYKRKEICKTEEEKREAIMRDAWNIVDIPNASEKLKRLAVEGNPWVIAYIHNVSQELLDYVYKNHRKIFDEYFEKVESYKRKEIYKTQKEQWKAVMQDAWNIFSIHNPREALIEFAIQENPRLLPHMPNLSEELIKFAIKRDPRIILNIPNASEELKRLAIEGNPGVILKLPNPSQELIDYLYKNHRAIFDKYFEKVES